MCNKRQPLISIAMTVFNAAPFLAKSIESLLVQDYENFELIISDNASEDSSSEICREFVRRDNRIKYYRNSINMGPARNSYKAVDLCSGNFIMPAADHDVYDPSFISRLLALLQQDESVVLAYPRSIYIDEDDHPMELLPDVIDTRGMDACQRFSKIIREFAWGNMVYGLYRIDAFRAVWHAQPIIGPDHVIIAKLSLLGSIAQIDEPLFFRRRNRPVEDTQECTSRQVALFVDSNLEVLVPWTRMAYEHIKIIIESKLGYLEKEFLFKEIRKCFPARFGEQMRNEAISLVTQGTEILLDPRSGPTTKAAAYTDLARLAGICRFFYPDIAELHQFIQLGAGLLSANAGIAGMTAERISGENKAIACDSASETVSVVIPTYNRARLISRSIRSVQNQTYPVTEIIIADNASTDDTEQVVSELSSRDSRIVYLKLPQNRGAQAARNAAIRRATGRWITFLDSDDEFLPQKIEKQLKTALLQKVPVVHCECYVQRGEKGEPALYGTRPLAGNIYAQVLSASYPGPTFPGLFVQKEALESIGLLDESVPSWQEWDTTIRLAKLYSFAYAADPLFIYYQHAGETISKDNTRESEGYARIVEKHANEIRDFAGPDVLAHHYALLSEKFNSCGLTDRADGYLRKKSDLEGMADLSQDIKGEVSVEERCKQLFKQASIFISRSDMASALLTLDQVQAINPNLTNLQFARAQCLVAMGEKKFALLAALEELKHFPGNIACRDWMASLKDEHQ